MGLLPTWGDVGLICPFVPCKSQLSEESRKEMIQTRAAEVWTVLEPGAGGRRPLQARPPASAPLRPCSVGRAPSGPSQGLRAGAGARVSSCSVCPPLPTSALGGPGAPVSSRLGWPGPPQRCSGMFLKGTSVWGSGSLTPSSSKGDLSVGLQEAGRGGKLSSG